MEKYPALKKRGDYYTNVSEPLKVGDAGIGSLRFIAYEGKLSAVLFSSFGTENCRRLLAILEAQYGTPQQATYSTRTWVGNVASLVYDEKVSGGLYGTTYTSAIIYIFNNEMAAQQKAIETDKAKKAAQTGL